MRKIALVSTLIFSVLLLVGFISLMLQRDQRLSGSNSVRPIEFVVNLPAKKTYCESGITVNTDARYIVVLIDGKDQPPLRLSLRDSNGKDLRVSRVTPPYVDGTVKAGIKPTPFTYSGVALCVKNEGRSAIGIAGTKGGDPPKVVDGVKSNGRIHIVLLRGGNESWFALATQIGDRFAVVKADFVEPWLFGLLMIFIAFVYGSCLLLFLRSWNR